MTDAGHPDAGVATPQATATAAPPVTVGGPSGVDHALPAGFGVYLHVPFCRHRCDYCSFAAWDDRHHLIDRYMTALTADTRRVVAQLPGPVTSVFVGGGTPSAVPPQDLAEIVRMIPLARGAEVTVEVNPEDATDDLFVIYRQAGINRISMGVQSTSASTLRSLGRLHQRDSVPSAVEAIRRAGFDSFNLDLIYGAAGESVSDWIATLLDVIELAPPHVSAYALTVEPGTPLAGDPARHPDDDNQAAMFLAADELLGDAGMQWYEISNWCAPGHECRHNQLYWTGGSYLGAGCSAHSHAGGIRWWNVRTPERYAALVESGVSPIAGSEELDANGRRLESLQLSLRTRRGVPASALRASDLDGVLAGLVTVEDERLVLTQRGRLLANEVAVRLM